jgi:hypothetical protein
MSNIEGTHWELGGSHKDDHMQLPPKKDLRDDRLEGSCL